MNDVTLGFSLTLPLWENNTPYSGDALPGLPRMTVYLSSPEYKTGKMVLVCPGGGYRGLAIAKEGHRIARFISSYGHNAAVLEYRHFPYQHPVPLIDAQRAIRLLRHQAEVWDYNPDKIGILGFSAGGHLAASAATLPLVKEGLVGDSVDQCSHRPNYAVLVYPVISFVHHTAHIGSRNALLGESADPALVESMSMENAVGPDTPPTLLIHTNEDQGVPPENSILFYQSLRKHNIPAELHIYEKGPHGIGLAANHPWGPTLLQWLDNR